MHSILILLGLSFVLLPSHLRATPKNKELEIVFVGDIMLGRRPGKYLALGQDPFSNLGGVLKQADLRIGNFECVAADSGTRFDKHYTFRADPQSVKTLAQYFDAVSLANNHTGDFGHDGLLEMMGHLKKAKVGFFGAGANKVQAHQPWIVTKKGVKLALLGYNEFRPRAFEAGEKTPGVAWSEDAEVVADIKAARPQADVIITYMHWGEEYLSHPNERQRTLARKMIEAGADIVIGGHPHITEGSETYKGKLIVYSLGNFVFDDFADMHRESRWELEELSRTSWMLRLKVNKQGVIGWETLVARTDDRGFPTLTDGRGPSQAHPFDPNLVESLAKAENSAKKSDAKWVGTEILRLANYRLSPAEKPVHELAVYSLDGAFYEAASTFKNPQLTSTQIAGNCRLRQLDFNHHAEYPDPAGFDLGIKQVIFSRAGEHPLPFLLTNWYRDLPPAAFPHRDFSAWLDQPKEVRVSAQDAGGKEILGAKVKGVSSFTVSAEAKVVPGEYFTFKLAHLENAERVRFDLGGYNTNRNEGYHLSCEYPVTARAESFVIPGDLLKAIPWTRVPSKEAHFGIEAFRQVHSGTGSADYQGIIHVSDRTTVTIPVMATRLSRRN